MKDQHLQEAIAIISKSNSIKVSFNVPVENHYSNVHQILIHESNAKVIEDLHKAGFSVFMTSKGLSVNKF